MKRKIYQLGAPLLAAILIAGCGGGGGGGGGGYYPFPPVGSSPPPTTPPPTNPPPMADAYDTFLAYLKGLVQAALDTAEPADVTAFDPPPTSDTKDPIAIQ